MKRGKTVAPLETLASIRSTEVPETQGMVETPKNLSLRISTLKGEPYVNLTPEKRERYKSLWRKAVFKTKIERALKKVSDEILVYGTTNELLDQNMLYRPNIDELIACCLSLSPKSNLLPLCCRRQFQISLLNTRLQKKTSR